MDLKYSSFWPLVVLHETSVLDTVPLWHPVKGFMHSIPFFIQLSNQCKHFSAVVEQTTGLPVRLVVKVYTTLCLCSHK